MNLHRTSPPRLAVRLIERRLSADEAESIVGDLSEEFDARAARSPRAAALWFWRQAIGVSLMRRMPIDVGNGSALSGVSMDLRLGARALLRAPGFAALAVTTLALGIGAATAVGTAAGRTLFRALPYSTGDRLVILGEADPDSSSVANVGYETALDWRARVTSLDELVLFRQWQPTMAEPSGAVRFDGMRVSWNYFRMLGIRPALGRDFEAADDTPDNWRTVIISDALWKRRFNGSQAIVGTSIDFNGRKYTVAGVLPPAYEELIAERYFERAEIWAPMGYAVGGDSSCRSCRHLRAAGRLRAGASIEQARAELVTVQSQMSREHPNVYRDTPPRIDTLQDVIAETMRRPMQLLMGAVAFVLFVACANVAGLLITRASQRTQEMALRSALGASRARIIRQLIGESAALGLLAAVGGFAIARGGLELLARAAPVKIPRIDGAAADPWLFATAAIVSIAAVMTCALWPALMSSRTELESTLREARQTSSQRAARARELLMAIEIAAALLVTAGGGLMYRTVDHLLRVDPGFEPKNVLTAGMSLVGARWAEDSDVRAFQSALLQRVRALPGVENAALAGQVPLGGNYDRWGIRVLDRPDVGDANRPSAERYSVTPSYFNTMRIPLKQGRLLTDADRFETEKVMVINETMARELWPNESALGKHVQFGSDERPRPMTVVGVVGDVRHYSLAGKPNAQFYAPQEQVTDSYLVLVVKAANPEQLAPAIRREVAALASDVPVYQVDRLDTLVSRSIATRSFLMSLLAALGSITLILTGVGLYGVVSQSVAARRRELGIRVALGATRSRVLSLIAQRGIVVFAAGAATGLAGAVGVGYLIESQLFETQPLDPVTLIGAVALMAVVAVVAHLSPVRRALAADPRETLRAD